MAKKDKTIYWYGLTKDNSQVKATDSEVTKYATKTNPLSLTLLWGEDTLELEDGTRLAKTKKGALKKGWEDIALAPFDTE